MPEVISLRLRRDEEHPKLRRKAEDARLVMSLKEAISGLIEHCKNATQLRQVHAQILTQPRSHLSGDHRYSLISRLIYFTAIPEWAPLPYATRIFRSVGNPQRNLYNVMIRGHASRPGGTVGICLALYKRMLSNGIAPDTVTIPFVMKGCDGVGTGRCVHGQAVKFGVGGDVFVNNSMVGFYSVSGLVDCARKVFDEMPDRDVVSWNSMMTGYLRNGCLEEAVELFDRMEERSVVSWNLVMTRLVQGGRSSNALRLFDEMMVWRGRDGVRPNKFTIATVLSACADLGAIDKGKWVHSYLERSGLECDMVIGTALVDMYGKCGSVEKAYDAFRKMSRKDTMAWTAMISAFALHGYSKEAFDVFEEMKSKGLKPNHVTFVGLFSACAHSGLVEKGRWFFEMMISVYSLEPQAHHYACMVDILGRAGHLAEAEELIRSMPMEPDVFVWGALLGGCQTYGNVDLGEKVARHLINLEPSNHAFYIRLCDLYAKGGRFDDAKRVRAFMKESGINKIPGCSTVEIDGVVYEFSVLGSHGVLMDQVNWVLNAIISDMEITRSMMMYR